MVDQGRVKSSSRKTTTMRTTSIVGAAGLVLGIVWGAGAGRTDPTDSPAYLSLQSDYQTASEDRTELEQQAQSLADENAELASANRELESAQSALERDQNAFERDREELEQDRDELAASLGRFKSRLADLQEREQAVEAAEAAVSVAPPASEPEPAEPAYEYYDNCTAARNAGAAPVRVGDPGYGPHLDRDGDGVGCEW